MLEGVSHEGASKRGLSAATINTTTTSGSGGGGGAAAWGSVHRPQLPPRQQQHEGTCVEPTELVHPEDGTYFMCKFCPKQFKFKSEAVRHMRTHTGEKPFQCHLCGHSTARQASLKYHYASIHEVMLPCNTRTNKKGHKIATASGQQEELS